jgi:predicted amidohydrolase YtcJ
MTGAADLVLTNAEVHTLAAPPGSPYVDGPGDEVHEAVAVRDGRIVRVGSGYDVAFLAGVDTAVIDCGGRVVLPGFVDAHTHLEATGQYLVHADLSTADSVDDAVAALRAEADAIHRGEADAPSESAGGHDEWVQGFGWDESEWPSNRPLRMADLDAVSDDRPVVAYRVDMHVAAVNSVAFEQVRDDLPEDDVGREGGTPTGVLVEDAVGGVRDAVDRDRAATRALVTAARDRAHELGVTAVHEKVRDSQAPRVYRDLAAAGDLDLRVRIDYWRDHLDAVVETGLRTNAGGPFVRVGAIKSFTDGSLAGHTAKLTEPYADVDPDARDDGLGKWVVAPDELRNLAARADEQDLQLTVHAIGDAAVAETVAAFEETTAPGEARHRVEHVELHDDDVLDRMADAGIVASCQPNFLRWADEGGLYEQRLGRERTDRSNRFRDLLDAGVPLAFGSDSMPMDPLLGVQHAVDARSDHQRLSVTEALRAYTLGAAYAGHDENRMGTVEAGKVGDFVVLEDSPWEHDEAIDDVDVALTVVDGEIVYDGRN